MKIKFMLPALVVACMLVTGTAFAGGKKEAPQGGTVHMATKSMTEQFILASMMKTLIEQAGDEYTVIVTADHGGHDRAHGTDMPEDMTIPMFFYGPDFEAGKGLHGVKLLDLAPTIAKLMNVNASPEWEGTPLI